MAPELRDQAAVVRVVHARTFLPGDVLAFYCPYQERILTHRLLGYVRSRGTWKLLTVADRGVRPDPLLEVPLVLGRMVGLEDRRFRIGPTKRLIALLRYLFWCGRLLSRRLVARRPSGD